VDDIPEGLSVVHRVRLLEMGSVIGGRAASAQGARKTLFTHLMFRKDEVLLPDTRRVDIGAPPDFVDAIIVVERRGAVWGRRVDQTANDID
jgi:hypothetical protein